MNWGKIEKERFFPKKGTQKKFVKRILIGWSKRVVLISRGRKESWGG